MKYFTLIYCVVYLSFFSRLNAQDVWFIDAGAGIVRADIFNDSYSYPIFNGVSFPDNIVFDENQGFIYWTDWTKDKIRRANLDGSEVTDIIIGVNTPKGIALDTTHQVIYWIEAVPGILKKANTDGSNITILADDISLGEEIALDVNSGYVFVIHSDGVLRVKTDGSESLLIHDESNLDGIEFNHTTNHVYFGTNNDAIKRMNTDGTDVATLISNAGNLTDGMFVDEVNNKLYWADYTEKNIYRANLDGSERETLISAVESGISDVYFDRSENMLYWVEPSHSVIRKKSFTTSDVVNILDGNRWGQISDLSVAQLGKKLVFVDRDSESIVMTGLEGENAIILADSVAGVVSLVYDYYGNDIYWSNRIEKTIYKFDVDTRQLTPLVTNVDVIAMDLDYVTRTLYFIDLTDKKIKYTSLVNPGIQTLATPFGTEPEDLAIQMQSRKIFWIDDVGEDIYSLTMPSGTSQLFINQGTNLSYLEASESLSMIVFIDAGKIFYTNDVNPSGFQVYYPGQVFPQAVRVYENPFIIPLTADYSVLNEIACSNDTLTVIIEPYGALPPVDYEWSDGYSSHNAIRHGVPGGNYEVTVTDLINRTVNVDVEIPFQFISPEVELELQNGSVTGSAQIVITGGTPPYSIEWEGPGIEITGEVFVELPPGDYSVTITDLNGCSTITYFTIELIESTIELLKGIQVTPTLVNDEINIKVENTFTDRIYFQVYDTNSRRLVTGELADDFKIDVSHFLPGMYLLHLSTDNGVLIRKFFKS